MTRQAGCKFNCLSVRPSRAFNRTVKKETKFAVSFADFLPDNPGWYLQPSEDGVPQFVKDLGFRGRQGVYLLWQEVNYCNVHEKEIYQAFYVGKSGSSIQDRLLVHFAEKKLAGGLAVYVTTWFGSNRQAKFVEQLMLDLFAFEENDAENTGTDLLQAAFNPGHWG